MEKSINSVPSNLHFKLVETSNRSEINYKTFQKDKNMHAHVIPDVYVLLYNSM